MMTEESIKDWMFGVLICEFEEIDKDRLKAVRDRLFNVMTEEGNLIVQQNEPVNQNKVLFIVSGKFSIEVIKKKEQEIIYTRDNIDYLL